MNADVAESYFDAAKRRFLPMDETDFRYRSRLPVITAEEEAIRRPYRTFKRQEEDIRILYEEVLRYVASQFPGVSFDIKRSLQTTLRKIRRHYLRHPQLKHGRVESIDVAKSIFYRGNAAYVVGRCRPRNDERRVIHFGAGLTYENALRLSGYFNI